MKEIRELLDSMDRPIAFRRALVDLTGSVQSALMLSQAIYWQERVIRKDGWWYKSIDDWQEETGLNRRRLETARKKNRKYLLSTLKDIPARLYWKVNREALKSDLLARIPGSPETNPQDGSAQVGGKRAPAWAERADPTGGHVLTALGDFLLPMSGKKPTSLYDSAHHVGGNVPAGLNESGEPDGRFHPNINMYTENTTDNQAEINREVVAEINSQNEKKVSEEDSKKEKENYYHHLINDGLRIFPEEDPERVRKFMQAATDRFPLDWIRDAIKESVIQNARDLRGVEKILEAWYVNGHETPSSSKPSGIARSLGSSSK